MTAYQDKRTTEQALLTGMKKVLHKPVTIETLSSVVDEYFPQKDWDYFSKIPDALKVLFKLISQTT